MQEKESTELENVTVHTRQISWTLQELKNTVDDNDIITNPDYQRRYVYDNKRASLLIESILIGIPIPVIYLAEEDEGVYSVIDGQQRITSFVRYLKNEFQLVGLTKLPNLNGMLYKDLEKGVQRKLKMKTISAVCIERGSNGSGELKYEIFSRLNLGAVKLKDQEVRNCIYRSKFNDMLKEIANTNPVLAVMFHDENKRFAYEERILRFFTLRNYMQLKGTYKIMMNAYMQEHASDGEEKIKEYKTQYNGLIELIKTVIGEDAFFAADRKKFNGAVYDSIIIPFSYFPKRNIMRHADEIRAEINRLKTENEDYRNWTYAGTNSGTKIRCRINAVMDILNRITATEQVTSEKRLFDASVKEKLFYPGCKCAYCGNQILSIEDCEVDHIIPYSMGGPTSIENAQLLHKSCNRSKGAKKIEEIDFGCDGMDEEIESGERD